MRSSVSAKSSKFYLFILGIVFFVTCSTPRVYTYLMNSYTSETLIKIEQVFKEANMVELGINRTWILLDQSQKLVRTQAVKNIKKTELEQDWKYFMAADTSFAWISYVPPKYLILSSALVQAFDSTLKLDYSPVLYHVWSHYEQGHFKKRSETLLATEFGGSNLEVAINYDPKKVVEQLILLNGGKNSSTFSIPFSAQEEIEAEWLAEKAFRKNRKDSLLIGEAWKAINPDLKWADDFLKIHTGKIKMAN